MFCKWCGMESETSDVCSWCSRPFSTAADTSAPPTSPTGQPSDAPTGAQAAAGAGGYDELDEDLSPLPFGGPVRPAPPRPAAPPPTPTPTTQPPPAAPPARPTTPPPAARPPISVPQASDAAPPRPAVPPVFTPPAAPRQSEADAPPRPAVSPLFVPPSDAPPRAARPPIFAQPPAAPEQAAPPSTPPAPPSTPPAAPAAPAERAPRPATPPTFTPPPLRAPATPPAGASPIPDRPDLQAIPIKRPLGAPMPPTTPIAAPRAPVTPPAAPPPVAPPPTAPPYSPPRTVQPTPPPAAPPLRNFAVPLGDVEQTPPPPSGPLQIDLPPLVPDDDDAMPPIAVPQTGRINLQPETPARPVAPPPPPPGVTTTLTRAPGRYYCRWCGMESDTADRCSWCHRDLRNLPPVMPGKSAHVTMTRPGQPGKKSVRQPVGKQEPPQPPAARAPMPPPSMAQTPAQAAPPPRPAPGAPQLGQFQAQKSKYYTDKVLDPISGTHYDVDTGDAETTPLPIEVEEALEKKDQYRQVGIYTGALIAAAAAGAFAVSAMPAWYLLFLAVLNIGAGFALPLLRVVGFRYDDDDDVFVAGALFLILGPYVGTIAYILLTVMRGGGNPALIAIGLSSAVIRIPMDMARGLSFFQCFQSLFVFTPPVVLQSAGTSASPDWATHVASHLMIFACLAAWFFADMFRQPDA